MITVPCKLILSDINTIPTDVYKLNNVKLILNDKSTELTDY